MLIRSFVKHNTILCGGCNTTAPLAAASYGYSLRFCRSSSASQPAKSDENWGLARMAQRRDRKDNQTATKLKMSHCIPVHWH